MGRKAGLGINARVLFLVVTNRDSSCLPMWFLQQACLDTVAAHLVDDFINDADETASLLSPDSESSDPGLVTYPECISYFTEKEGQPQMCSRVLSIWGETMEGYKKVWAPQVKWMSVGSGAIPCCHYTLRTQEQESHEYTLLVSVCLCSLKYERGKGTEASSWQKPKESEHRLFHYNRWSAWNDLRKCSQTFYQNHLAVALG